MKQYVERTRIWLNHTFRDRQILIRSDGDVTYLPLSRIHQMIAVGTVIGTVVWGLIFTVGFGMSVARNAEQADQIASLEIGYADMILASATSSQSQMASSLPGSVLDGDAIEERVLNRNQELQQRIAALESDLALTRTERDDAVTTAEAATGALSEVEEARDTLRAELAAVESDMTAMRSERDSLALLRDGLSDEQGSLLREIELTKLAEAQARAYAEGLEGRISELTGSVQEAFDTVDQLIDHRDRLTGELVAVRGELSEAEAEITSLDDLLRRSYINAMWRSMENDALRDQLGETNGRTGALQMELARLETAQESLVGALQEQTELHVSSVQEGLAFTGLDIEDMLERLRSEQPGGQGGPLIPLLPDVLRGTPMEEGAEALLTTVVLASELTALANALPLAVPMDEGYRLSSVFGARRDPFTGRTARHEGLDFAASRGTPIYAAAPGIVTYSSRRGAYGNMVEIDHGLGMKTRYAHMYTMDVAVGDSVQYGEQIGTVGNTGRSTGPHLHYEVRVDGTPRNPMNFLEAGRYVFQVATED